VKEIENIEGDTVLKGDNPGEACPLKGEGGWEPYGGGDPELISWERGGGGCPKRKKLLKVNTILE